MQNKNWSARVPAGMVGTAFYSAICLATAVEMA
jgi:hypothetical protein